MCTDSTEPRHVRDRVRAFRDAVMALATRGERPLDVERLDVDRRGRLSALCVARTGTRVTRRLGVMPADRRSGRVDAFPPERDPKLFPSDLFPRVRERVAREDEYLAVAGYRPLKRVVLEIGENEERRFLRIRRRPIASDVRERAACSGAYAELDRVDVCEGLTVETWHPAGGESLRALMSGSRAWPERLHPVGEAVARIAAWTDAKSTDAKSTDAKSTDAASAVDASLAAAPAEPLRRVVADAMLARSRLALVDPRLMSACDRMVRRAIDDVHDAVPSPTVNAHGDLHDGQIFIDGRGCRLIDPDAFGLAPLEWDIANLSAHLVLETGAEAAPEVERGEAILIESYVNALPPRLARQVSSGRFRALERLAVARLVGVHGCRPTTRHRVPRLVEWLRRSLRTAERSVLCAFAALIGVTSVGHADGAAPRLREGIWVEVQGDHHPGHKFVAGKIEVKRYTSSRHPELLGVIDAIHPETAEIELLGVHVRVGRADREGLAAGMHVEVTLADDTEVLVARSVRVANEDDDSEIEGWLTDLSSDRERFGVNGVAMRLSSSVTFDVRGGDAVLLAPPIADVFERSRSDDDWQPEGQRLLHRNVRMGGRVTARVESQSGLDLDASLDDELVTSTMDARMHVRWDPSPWVVAYVEARGSGRRTREEGLVGSLDDRTRWRSGPTFVAARAPAFPYLALQAGRIDMEEDREWFYDQNLDGLRLHLLTWGPTAEVGVYRTDITPAPSDRDETYAIARLSLAPGARVRPELYYLSRQDRRESADDRRWLGARLTTKHRHVRTWLDGTRATGDYRGRELDTWAFDAGGLFKWRSPFRGSLYAGLARASGDDDRADGVDREYRDTGLSDFTDAMDGLKSFDYYGELSDPELSNLRVTTLGVGVYATSWMSIDVVHHTYRQESLRNRFRSDIPIDPTGNDKEIGRELDVVVGVRGDWLPLDVELSWGRFSPGHAFEVRDPASTFTIEMEWRR